MSETKFSQEEIERYLFGEISDEDRAEFEEKFFLDDELFFEIADAENRLVDSYANGKLKGEKAVRFEKSLEKFPERRKKLANAEALQIFIQEEREIENPAAVSATTKTFWDKLSEIFVFRTPAFGLTAAGLLILFLFLSVFLMLENRRKSAEIASLQNGREIQNRENDLQTEIAESKKRENELQNQIESEKQTSGDLSLELEKERTRREAIENELEKIRKQTNSGVSAPVQTEAPLIASIVLKPFIATRSGGDERGVKSLTIEKETSRVALNLSITNDSVKKGALVTVKLNDETIAENLPVTAGANGEKSVLLTLQTKDLAEGVNRLTIADASANEVGRYVFRLQRK